MAESSYKKIVAAPVHQRLSVREKLRRERVQYINMKTKEEKMGRVIDILELIGGPWLQLMKLVNADDAIPVPRASGNGCMLQVPTHFEWTNPKTNKIVWAYILDYFDALQVGIGGDPSQPMTPEEAYATIKAVLSQE